MTLSTPQPSHTGQIGRAYRLPDEVAKQKETCLACYFLDLPQVHPIWPRYQLAVVHLRDVPGLRPAVRWYPEAEYELAIYALNPGCSPRPDDVGTWQQLQPANMVFQFHGTGGAGAAQLADEIAPLIVEGRLWVETSDVRGERERWEAYLKRHVELIRERLA